MSAYDAYDSALKKEATAVDWAAYYANNATAASQAYDVTYDNKAATAWTDAMLAASTLVALEKDAPVLVNYDKNVSLLAHVFPNSAAFQSSLNAQSRKFLYEKLHDAANQRAEQKLAAKKGIGSFNPNLAGAALGGGGGGLGSINPHLLPLPGSDASGTAAAADEPTPIWLWLAGAAGVVYGLLRIFKR